MTLADTVCQRQQRWREPRPRGPGKRGNGRRGDGGPKGTSLHSCDVPIADPGSRYGTRERRSGDIYERAIT